MFDWQPLFQKKILLAEGLPRSDRGYYDRGYYAKKSMKIFSRKKMRRREHFFSWNFTKPKAL